jgi:nitrogen fixation NifU-like protein
MCRSSNEVPAELMDHFESPRHVGVIEAPDAEFRAANPVCGDEIRVMFRLTGGRIEDVAFRALGCHASIAAMSLLAERIHGRTVAAALEVTPETLAGWFADFPPGRAHAAEVAVDAVRGALLGMLGPGTGG